jgi:hypothetical protein
MNIHTYGQVIPYNPDNLPERGLAVGPGTERPAGFVNLELLAKLYWTVKKFKVAVAAVPLLDFTFEAFLLGGGATGTILGATAGVASAAAATPIPAFLNGDTKAISIFSKKIRKSRDGVYYNQTQSEFFDSNEGSNSTSSSNGNNKTPNALDLDLEIKKNYLVSRNKNPTEGSLVTPGLYHRFLSSQGAVLINFADIVYVKRQYWPKILIFLRSPVNQSAGGVGGILLGGSVSFQSAIVIQDPLFSAALTNADNATAFDLISTSAPLSSPTIGGINFLGNVIPLFGGGNLNTFAIFGSVSIGQDSSSSSSN